MTEIGSARPEKKRIHRDSNDVAYDSRDALTNSTNAVKKAVSAQIKGFKLEKLYGPPAERKRKPTTDPKKLR